MNIKSIKGKEEFKESYEKAINCLVHCFSILNIPFSLSGYIYNEQVMMLIISGTKLWYLYRLKTRNYNEEKGKEKKAIHINLLYLLLSFINKRVPRISELKTIDIFQNMIYDNRCIACNNKIPQGSGKAKRYCDECKEFRKDIYRVTYVLRQFEYIFGSIFADISTLVLSILENAHCSFTENTISLSSNVRIETLISVSTSTINLITLNPSYVDSKEVISVNTVTNNKYILIDQYKSDEVFSLSVIEEKATKEQVWDIDSLKKIHTQNNDLKLQIKNDINKIISTNVFTVQTTKFRLIKSPYSQVFTK